MGCKSSSTPEKNVPCKLMLSKCLRGCKSFTLPTTCLPRRNDFKFGNHLKADRFPAGWHILSLSNRRSKFKPDTDVIFTPSNDVNDTCLNPQWLGSVMPSFGSVFRPICKVPSSAQVTYGDVQILTSGESSNTSINFF